MSPTPTDTQAPTGAETQPASKVPFRLRLGWGVGTLGTSMLFNAFSAFALYFLSDVVGLGPALAGTLILVGRIYDMVTDIPMGVLSDRTTSRWGRRRPYLFLGGLLCALAMYVLFNPPQSLSEQMMTVYAVGALLLFATAYTVFNVPYMAMPSEMSTNVNERTAIMSFRTFFIAIAGLLATGVGGKLIKMNGGGYSGYGALGVFLAVIVGCSMIACFFGTAGVNETKQDKTRMAVKDQLRLAFQNKPFFLLITAKFLQLFGIASVTATLIFFLKSILGYGEDDLLNLGLALTAGQLISLPLWVMASRRYGKRNVYLVALTGFALTQLSWLVAGPDELATVFYSRLFCSGVFSTGVLLQGFAMLPDAIAYDYTRTGLRREGSFAALYSLAEKTASALGPSAIAWILGLFGYVSGVDGEVLKQSDLALFGLKFGVAILPAITAVMSMGILYFYNLSKEDLDREPPARADSVAEGAGAEPSARPASIA